MKISTLHRPYLIQVEPVMGCNFNCKFCANSSFGNIKNFMSIATAISIAEGLSYWVDEKFKVSFAMRGEPTLHPDLQMIITLFRQLLPKAQLNVLTNGSLIRTKKIKIDDLFACGLNFLTIDCYGDTYGKTLDLVRGGVIPVYDYRDKNYLHYHSNKIQCISLINDLTKDNKTTRTFTNQCDYIPDEAYNKFNIQRPNMPLQKTCTNPFRELSFHYNGDAQICCKDWLGYGSVFNIAEGSLKDYWYNNEYLNKLRILLQHRRRDYWPCLRCTYFGGYRVGLLPKVPSFTKKKLNQLSKELHSWRNPTKAPIKKK
jgi:MoaA/NifB/PqqE/SkfB family radical SAM enzyme